MQPHERIFVALDTPDAEGAVSLARKLRGHVGGFKVGLELFSSHGPPVVEAIREVGAVFLDLKLHDIPNTAAGAAAAAGRLGVSYFTVHASGGSEMIRRAVAATNDAAVSTGMPEPVVLAVTVLTSHDDASLEATGMRGPCDAAVERLADLARDAGAGGLVCSPLEVEQARRGFPGGQLVVPGIRLAAAGTVAGDDQSRTATPGQVVANGADRIVVGRPITRAEDPVAAADELAADIAATSTAP
jgi:orotidine-5'-phosphate decarboxylase